MIFDRFAPPFKDRTTDASLNAEFGATYPNLVQDRWDNSAATRIDTNVHPFQLQAFGPTDDYYCYADNSPDNDFKWTYSWTTTKADSTSLGSIYPTFTR